ncbi:MAG: WecB/TagA/CpsF family glycosyltransferase [Patescibacteria group bacterium]
MKKINILGIKICSLSFNEAIKIVDELIVKGKPAQIVTVNPEFIVVAQKDIQFKKILNQADLALPDGVGLILAGRILGTPLKERITGVDLTWAICKLAEDRGYSVFFLGGIRGVAKETASRIKKIHSRLLVAGYYEGKPNDAKTWDAIERVRPNILFVAFGAPKQDKFIYDLIHSSRISHNPSLSIGVGGTFDYIAGRIPRAPEWLRNLGLEWLYRFYSEPWRIKRIFKAVIVFPILVIFDVINSYFRR